MLEVETMETGSSVGGGGGGEEVTYSDLNGGGVDGIDYLSMSSSIAIGGDGGGGGTSFQPLTICELNNSSAMPYLFSTDLSLDSGGGGGDGTNLEGTTIPIGGDDDNGGGDGGDNFEASLITLNDISNSYHGNPLASLGGLEGWTNGGIEDYNWINNGENYSIPVNTAPSLSTCSTSLYNYYEEDEKECQKDLDEILNTGYGGDGGDDDDGGNKEEEEDGEKKMDFPPTKATCLNFAVKSKPLPRQVSDEEDDNEDEEDGGDQEVDSEENEETIEEKGKKERQIRQERCSECSMDFRFPCRYEQHMEAVHSEKYPYPCSHPGCSKKFAKHHQRQQHSYTHDPKRFEGKGKWECGLCDKVYHVRCSLYQHWKMSHPGIGPEERKQLIAKQREENNLKGDGGGGGIRSKTEILPVVGAGVTQIFRKMKKRQIWEEKKKRRSSETSMKKNEEVEVPSPAPAPLVVVEETRPGHYPCKFCGKVFDVPWNLKQHVMLHTGEKPIKCPKCPERFRLKQTLTSHLRRNHRSKKERRNILKMYKCRVCGRDDFEMWQASYTHRTRAHKEVEYVREKEKPFGCGICLKPYFLREDAIICAVLGHEPGMVGEGGRRKVGKRYKERVEEIKEKGLGVEGMGFESALYFDLTEKGPSEMEQHLVAGMMLEVVGKGGRDGRQICTLCGEEVSNKGNFKRHLNLVHVSEEMAKTEEQNKGPEEDEEDEEEMEDDKEEEEKEPPKKKIREEVVEEKEGISVFKCRFCDKEFGKKRALHFHEVRGHINPKKPREEENGAGGGGGGKKGRRGGGGTKEKKVLVVEDEEEKEDSDGSNGSDLFTVVVERRRRICRRARKGGEEKWEIGKLGSVNLNDPLAVANALNFKSLRVVVRDLSREDILGMNEGKIGNLSFLDGGTREREEVTVEVEVEEETEGRRSGRRRGRPPGPVTVKKKKEEKIRKKRGSRGRGGGSQGEHKTAKKTKGTGKGTGRRGRPPKKKRGRWGKKVENEEDEDKEGEEDPEENEENERGTVKMTKAMKKVAKIVMKLQAEEENTQNEEIARQAVDEEGMEEEGGGDLEGMEENSRGVLEAAVRSIVEEDSIGGSERSAQRVEDSDEEEDEDMEDMINEELEEMMEEAQLDDWLAQVDVPIPNVGQVEEHEDSVQFLGEFSGSDEEGEEGGLQGIQLEELSNSSSSSSASESETEEEDVEEEELIGDGEEENANLEAIVPMHHFEEEEDEENDLDEDPLLLENFTPPPTPRSPPPRRRLPPVEPPQQQQGEEEEDEDEDEEDEDEDEVDEEEESEAEGTVSSTTEGYPAIYNLDEEDSNPSVIFEGVHEDGRVEGEGGVVEREGEEESTSSASGGSDEMHLLRNIPGINPNLIRNMPKVVLRRIEQDHRLNVNLALIRNNNEDSI